MSKTKDSLDLYTYKAKFISNYDGDTVRLNVDLGMETNIGAAGKGIPFRLYGIDTPEMRGDDKAAGKRSKDAVSKMLHDAEIFIQTVKGDSRGKYGRYLATILITQEDGTLLNLNHWLVAQGLAVFKDY